MIELWPRAWWGKPSSDAVLMIEPGLAAASSMPPAASGGLPGEPSPAFAGCVQRHAGRTMSRGQRAAKRNVSPFFNAAFDPAQGRELTHLPWLRRGSGRGAAAHASLSRGHSGRGGGGGAGARRFASRERVEAGSGRVVEDGDADVECLDPCGGI